MAIRDVKEYYFKMLGQYTEMKADIADFEQALKDGFITEEQLQAAIDEVYKVQQNYDRLTYIMYLLSLPNRKSKQPRYNKINKKLVDGFEARKATAEAVDIENRCALKAFREELKRLEEQSKKKNK
jgi:hypothetical protein